MIKLYKAFKLKRLKSLAKDQFMKHAAIRDELSCGHRMAMNVKSYNNSYFDFKQTMLKINKLDPSSPLVGSGPL